MARGNGASGVLVIGRWAAVHNNTIAANVEHGLQVGGLGAVIVDNLLGVAADGQTPAGNGKDGVFLDAAGIDFRHNIVCGNLLHGVLVGPLATGALLTGNFIGVNPLGVAIGNAHAGVFVSARIDVIVNNSIAFNGEWGIVIQNKRQPVAPLGARELRP
jgi:hypothetical protein